MATNALVQTRIDADVRDRASAVLEGIGLTVSDAVRILLTRTANEALPLELVTNSEAHDAWFRTKVQEALQDTRPDVPDEQAETHFAARRADARRKAARRIVKLVWSAFALADRDGIFTHIEADNPRAAIAVDERIATAARRLVDFPESGRPGRVAGTRELVITGTPYVAAYAVTAETIRILRVLHGAQRWPDELPQG